MTLLFGCAYLEPLWLRFTFYNPSKAPIRVTTRRPSCPCGPLAGPKTTSRRPKILPTRPRIAQGRPKTALRRPKDGLRPSQMASGVQQTAPISPEGLLQAPERPSRAQERPETAEDPHYCPQPPQRRLQEFPGAHPSGLKIVPRSLPWRARWNHHAQDGTKTPNRP